MYLVSGGSFVSNALLMHVMETIFSNSTFPFRHLENSAVRFAVFVLVHGKNAKTPNTNIDKTSPSGPIVPLIALMLMRRICFSSIDLCSVLRILKTRSKGL